MTINEARDLFLNGEKITIEVDDNNHTKYSICGKTLRVDWYEKICREYGEPTIIENNCNGHFMTAKYTLNIYYLLEEQNVKKI